MQRFFTDLSQLSLTNALATAIAIVLLTMPPRCLKAIRKSLTFRSILSSVAGSPRSLTGILTHDEPFNFFLCSRYLAYFFIKPRTVLSKFFLECTCSSTRAIFHTIFSYSKATLAVYSLYYFFLRFETSLTASLSAVSKLNSLKRLKR